MISVIASDSTVTALNGPLTEASGCLGYRNAGWTRTDSPSPIRSAVPISFSRNPSSSRVLEIVGLDVLDPLVPDLV